MATPIYLTEAEARRLTDERFALVSRVTTRSGRCYEAWTETWHRKDGADAIDLDIHAFELQPRGQGHSVRASGPDVTLNCTCDSSD